MTCDNNLSPFPCVQCGMCCQRVNLAEETRFLDQGDGTCRHYDTSNKSCSIYHDRPDICRVDLQFEQHYCHFYTWDEFVELNLTVCRQLIAEEEGK
ncbi:zinc/iron-chelating domain-containing protein [Enterobacteriaceae bacterium ENNIH3]|nr:zinc/iron-chelating domain-containing protein [Enterobacteriaceae bacterium ENNIH3]AUV05132.1 zinc/iron-chelating domain-containing protein [Enterobacteriaceae bacterium ENNIH2]PWF51996.1 zinc/iron-chelating domain-containing protein [[Kluyvera] intestini]